MGVDTNVYLAHGTQSSDVANVCSILLGHLPETLHIDTASGGFDVVRTNAKVRPGSDFSPGMLDISVPWIEGSGLDALSAPYFVDGGDAEWHHSTGTMHLIGRPMLKLRARPERLALATRLVDLFGGSVDYDDCDSVYEDYKARGHRLRRPNSEQYEAWQMVMRDLAPLTWTEINSFRDRAGYDVAEHLRAA